MMMAGMFNTCLVDISVLLELGNKQHVVSVLYHPMINSGWQMRKLVYGLNVSLKTIVH